jgi:hypothetical protein
MNKIKFIDIHVKNESPFIYCCQTGNLEMAQCLWKLSKELDSPIDIHANNEQIFLYCCKNNRLEMAKWLYNLSLELNSPIDIPCTRRFCIYL